MDTVDMDTCLRLVADEHRRRLIQQLRQEANGRMAVDELVTQLRREEFVPDRERPPDRGELAIKLYHNHLPKLANHGVVEYDAEAGTVRYRSDEQLEAVLDALPEDAPRVDS